MMLPLYGLTSPLTSGLKRQLLLFDGLFVLGADAILDGGHVENFDQQENDLRFLHSQGIIQPISNPLNFAGLIEDPVIRTQPHVLATFDLALRIEARYAAAEFTDVEFAPVCHGPLPTTLKSLPGLKLERFP